MSNDGEKKEFSYFISEKPPFAVIIFLGSMTKAEVPLLEECQKDLLARPGTLCALVFRDVTSIDLTVIPALTKLQKALRERGALRVCSLRPELKTLLLDKAAIRDAETLNNLAEALESLKTVTQQK